MIHHDNITVFVGAILDDIEKVFLLHEYCQKGSLQVTSRSTHLAPQLRTTARYNRVARNQSSN